MITGLLALGFTGNLIAQNLLVKGRTADAATGEPIGYAVATLLRDSTILTAAAATDKGHFELKAPAKGRYRLTVSLVGYQPYEQIVEINASTTNIGTIKLHEGVDIADVVVTVQKPLVLSDAEKMSYSVEDDPQASTSTLEEIIRKVPQLSIDAEGNVLLNGESNYKILVDGRSNATMSNQFKEVIKSMPASQIQRIEVITNPSTKYEAEGVGGIINLITDRTKRFDGYYGSLSGGANLYGSPMYYGNVNTSVQSGKFAIGLMGYYSNYASDGRYAMRSESEQENFGSDTRYQRSEGVSPYKGDHYGATLDVSYTIDTLNLLTLNAALYAGAGKTPGALSQTELLDPDRKLLMSFGSESNSRYKYLGGSVGLAYEHTFGRRGHTLTISDEWEISPNESHTLNRFTGVESFDSYESLSEQESRTMGNTLQIDYVNPLSQRHNIEAGMKYIFRSSENDQLNSILASDLAMPDRMEYRQQVLAIYAGYGFSAGRWSGRVGTRLEQTWNRAEVTEPDAAPYRFDNDLTNLVPYASISFRPQDRHSLSLSYTQRLQRPGIQWLSPAVNDTQPTSVSFGNPDLQAAIYHTVNFQYGHFSPKWSLMAGLSTRLSNNNMTSYTYNRDGVTYSTYSDEVRSRFYGINATLSLRPSQKLNLSLTIQGGYNDFNFAPQGIRTDRFACSENLNVDVALWKEGRLMLGEYYNSGDARLGSWNDPFWYYYAGIKQSLFKKQLDITLMVTNPFNGTTEWSTHAETPTYASYSKTLMKSRAVSLRVSWRFGQQQVRVKRTARSIQNDDLQQGGQQNTGAPTGMGM